uniref:Putative phage/plasmid DNA primase n=1 Tax=Coleochaete scutata TaxID=3125 RepID=A0A5P9NVX4_COLSC|nr:putative phage/plasmid DNA primase [Coleochaete scutata]QFU80110.1 putative phage/plasmid DNA primase [Coleochaete scutata]
MKAAEIVIQTLGQDIEFNNHTGQWFIYSYKTPGVWCPVSDAGVMSLIHYIFKKLDLFTLVSTMSYFASIKQVIQCHHLVLRNSYPSNPRDTFVFSNCVLTCEGAKKHSHEPRVYTGFSYSYYSDAQCPIFLEFITEFCSHKPDRVLLIRAFLRCCLESATHVHKLIEFVGEQKTGKSTLQTVFIAVIGLQNSIVTTLKDINSNRFKASSLQHKKLIVISDTEPYTGSVSMLNMISGNDFIMEHRSHDREAYNIFIEGMVVLFGDHPVSLQNVITGFIKRRIQFPARNVVEKGHERVLIRAFPDGTFDVELAKELSGIFNWAMKLGHAEAMKIMTHPEHYAPSLSASICCSPSKANSIASWIEAELIPGEGMYVGGAHANSGQTHLAFPLYYAYCKRKNVKEVSLKVFSKTLISIIRSQYSKVFNHVEYVRKRVGTYIEGIAVNPIVFDPDYRKGGLIASEWKPQNMEQLLSTEEKKTEAELYRRKVS